MKISALILMIFTTLPMIASSEEAVECDICSEIVEIDRLKARCFDKRYESILSQFSADVYSVEVDFDCSLKRRSVTNGLSEDIQHDPNVHFLTKNAVLCLKQITADVDRKLDPSTLIDLSNDC